MEGIGFENGRFQIDIGHFTLAKYFLFTNESLLEAIHVSFGLSCEATISLSQKGEWDAQLKSTMVVVA